MPLPYTPTPDEYRRLGYTHGDLAGADLQIGRGCTACRFTGYKGRVGIFELLVLNDEVKEAVLARKTVQEIRRVSIETSGLITLMEDGIAKAARGKVSLPEVMRRSAAHFKTTTLARIASPVGRIALANKPLTEIIKEMAEADRVHLPVHPESVCMSANFSAPKGSTSRSCKG